MRKWKIPPPELFRSWMVEARNSTEPRISQRELAAMVGCHRLTIAAIEQGRKDPTLATAHAIWRSLDAAFAGRLWVAVQVRRDNRQSNGRARSDIAGDAIPVKIRRLAADDPTRPSRSMLKAGRKARA